MYLVKILNADHRPVDVEVSLEIYRVYEESRKQEERQRYERRKHIEGKSFDDCLLYDLATEPLEETAERLETLLEIGQVLEKLPPLQRWRFILHFFYGYHRFRDAGDNIVTLAENGGAHASDHGSNRSVHVV